VSGFAIQISADSYLKKRRKVTNKAVKGYRHKKPKCVNKLRSVRYQRARERKSRLKIKRVAVEAMLMKRKDVIKQSAIAFKKNPV